MPVICLKKVVEVVVVHINAERRRERARETAKVKAAEKKEQREFLLIKQLTEDL
jgi:hypothetical protein